LLLDRNVDEGADQFLGLLLQSAAEKEHAVSILTFAARLLMHLVPRPSIRRRVFDACWSLATTSLDDDTGIAPLAKLLTSALENRDSVAGMIRQRVIANDLPGMAAVLAVTLDQICDPRGHPDPRIRWYKEARQNVFLARAALRAQAQVHMHAAMELVFCGEMTIAELIAAHGPAAVCEVPLTASTYRRMSILAQVALAHHDIKWHEWHAHIAIEPIAASWADDVASTLPLTSAPWARLSKLAYWDMTIDSPVNSTPTGTAQFDVLVLCSCLYSEARDLARRHFGLSVNIGSEPLPSWLRLGVAHPLNTVMAATAQGAAALQEIPASWLSPAVRQFVNSWAAGDLTLVVDDIDEDAAAL